MLYKDNRLFSSLSELYHANSTASGDNATAYDALDRLAAFPLALGQQRRWRFGHGHHGQPHPRLVARCAGQLEHDQHGWHASQPHAQQAEPDLRLALQLRCQRQPDRYQCQHPPQWPELRLRRLEPARQVHPQRIDSLLRPFLDACLSGIKDLLELIGAIVEHWLDWSPENPEIPPPGVFRHPGYGSSAHFQSLSREVAMIPAIHTFKVPSQVKLRKLAHLLVKLPTSSSRKSKEERLLAKGGVAEVLAALLEVLQRDYKQLRRTSKDQPWTFEYIVTRDPPSNPDLEILARLYKPNASLGSIYYGWQIRRREGDEFQLIEP